MDTSTTTYEVCVVGAGMVGSSAAKYVAKTLNSRGSRSTCPPVCLIGPEEPKSREGQTIFAAHYDEARITRLTSVKLLWAILSRRSTERYRDIEKESGYKFYDEVGCLSVGDPNTDNYMDDTYQSAVEQNVTVSRLTYNQLRTQFPFLGVSSTQVGVWELDNAGIINPRRLVAAQQLLAQREGCDVIRDVVSSVVPVEVGEGGEVEGVLKITTDKGRVLFARKVLLATNAFTEGFRQLLPPGVHLDMQPVSQAVVLAELNRTDLHTLKRMPSILFKSFDIDVIADNTRAPEPVDDDSYDSYILPPVKYPNGKTYLKLGHGKNLELLLSPADMIKWYTNPVPKSILDDLKKLFAAAFPGIHPLSFTSDTCVTVHTHSHGPYIDLVTSRLGIAVGDCGCSAKCCDEFGRLAANLLIEGKWNDTVLNWDDFKMRTKPKTILTRSKI